MEPWKLAVIAALGAGIVGFGMLTNRQPELETANTSANPSGAQPTAVPIFAKYVGGSLPSWPNVNQWVNTPAPVGLPSLKGKTTLLEVFRIDCSHCQAAAPFIAALHSRYAPRGVTFVAIQSPGDTATPDNPESNWTTVQQWIKAKGYTWPVGFDAKSAWFQGKFGKNVFYPALFLLDKSGKVVFAQSGHDAEKALQLAAELEHIAPGKGDVNARSTDLSRFIMPALNMPRDTATEKSLATEVAKRLQAIK